MGQAQPEQQPEQMTKLEAGDIWHKYSKYFTDKYHNGQFQLQFRFGFDVRKLSPAELNRYVMIYTAVMNARGHHQGMPDRFNQYKCDILNSNTK